MAKKTAETKKKTSTRGGKSTRSKSTPRKPTSTRTNTKRRTSRQKKIQPVFDPSRHQKAIMAGLGLIFIMAIMGLSLLSPTQGQLTQLLANSARNVFGWGAIILPVVLGSTGSYLILWGMEQPPKFNVHRLIGIALFFVTFEALATLFVIALDNGISNVWLVAQQQRGGGYLGSILAWLVVGAVGPLSGALIYLILASLSLFMASGVSRAELGLRLRKLAERPERIDADHYYEDEDEEYSIPVNPASLRVPRHVPPVEDDPDITPQAVEEDLDRAKDVRRRHQRLRAERLKSVKEAPVKRPRKTPVRQKSKQAEQPEPEVVAPAMTPNVRSKGEWNLPDVSTMLELGVTPESAEETVQEQWMVIEQTLESFGAPGKIVDVNPGPTVTQFGVVPLYVETRSGKRTKVKVSKIAGLADDLSLALAAKSVRIEAPVPGKGYIGIEVPNAAKVIVSLRDILEDTAFQRVKSPLRIGLGQDVAGNAIAADLAKMPHLLVAGATGSGKSVCVNSIIASLLLHNSPDELQFVMVDPKRVELTGYNGIPHLAAPVVVEMDRVVGVLQWALREMDSRYTAFANAGARNLTSYNRKVEASGQDKLPYMVIIIDELADLMMTAPEDTERALARLAQMARATGIHMIVATQRPSVDVVTGLIKANFPARIAFAVSSSTDSRVILDSVGAERLLGMGDMLFQKPDAPSPMRMQGCYVSDEELNKLIGYWKTARRFHHHASADTIQKRGRKRSKPKGERPVDAQTVVKRNSRPTPSKGSNQIAEPESVRRPTRENRKPAQPKAAPPPAEAVHEQVNETFQQPLWEHLIEEEKKKDQHVDELWDDAVAFVRQSGKASTSMLQRRFRIGYTRSARIVDAMEEAGIIGPPTGTSKAREVLPK
ncbi:MAG: DNA translocase FtsK 4TM domain-containing protein [Candidatus Promineifilaceae bacterium]